MPALTWLRKNWLPIAMVGGFALILILFKHSPTEGIDSLTALDKAVSSGQPALIEFYSNF